MVINELPYNQVGLHLYSVKHDHARGRIVVYISGRSMHLKSHIHIFQDLQLSLSQMPMLNAANDLSQEPIRLLPKLASIRKKKLHSSRSH